MIMAAGRLMVREFKYLDLVDEDLSTLPRQIKLFDLDGHERVDTSSKTSL